MTPYFSKLHTQYYSINCPSYILTGKIFISARYFYLNISRKCHFQIEDRSDIAHPDFTIVPILYLFHTRDVILSIVFFPQFLTI
jgi:hypothetical protein